jgi:sugar diacid utilization regulator
MDVLRHCRILAGGQCLDRPVEHVNVLEVFVDGDESIDARNHVLLTTFAFTGNDSVRQAGLIETLARSGCAAILFQEGVVAPLSATVTACADRLGLPVIEVPRTVLYHEIIEPLAAAILQEDVYRLHHALAVHRRLSEVAHENAGLPGLLEAVATLLGRGVAVFGRWEGIVGESSAWNGRCSPPIDRLISLKEFARVESSWVIPLRGEEWLVVAVENDDDMLSPIDRVTLEETRAAVALEVYRQRSIEQTERRLREELLDAILTCHSIETYQALVQRAKAIHWAIGACRVVVQLRVEARGDSLHPSMAPSDETSLANRDRAVLNMTQALSKFDPAGAVGLYRGSMVYLPSDGDDGEIALQRLRKRLDSVLSETSAQEPEWEWRIGIGSVAEDVVGLGDSWTQAETASTVSRALPVLGAIVEYDQVVLPSLLLELSTRIDVQRWQRRLIGPLMSEEGERVDLIGTLDVFLDSGDSYKQAARVLGLHPKSLKYRMERIAALLQIDPVKADNRLSLHLAVKLARVKRARR